MLEEGVGAGAEVINQALYGGSKSSDLGEALYELKEEKRKSCTYYKEVATFYNDYVVIQNAKQFCCLPMHYEEYIIPKYKLCGAVVSKGVSWFTIVWGFLFLLVGIGLLMNEDLVGVGVGLLFLSFILLLLPMCMSRYYTELQVLDDPDASPTVYNLRTFKKPDDDFIMLYVYGTLHNNTQGYHALAHLIDDSLVSKVRPLEMTGIQIDAAQLPNPPAAPAVPGAAGAINSGYGKQLYALAQTTGLCGDDESSPCAKWGTSCLRNTTRATFCENFIVISTEQKILCYPECYKKVVVPKYKISQCAFRKGGSTAGLLKLYALLGVSILVLIGGISMQQPTTTCDNFQGSCLEEPNPSADLGGIFVALGVAVMLIALGFIIMVLFFSIYQVDLVMSKPGKAKDEGAGAAAWRKFSQLMGPEVMTLTLRSEPNKEFIMSYVYGVLSKHMGGYHALTHLIKDQLVDPPRPLTVNGAIAGTGLKTAFMPVAQATPMPQGLPMPDAAVGKDIVQP